MVVRAAGPPGRRIILFNYEPSRTVASLQSLLIGPQGPYTGKLLTDGLELYDAVAEALKLVHLGCLQHCGARQATCRFISCSEAPFLLVNGDLNDRVALGVQRDCRDRCPVARMA
jgi:hypothetical protein